jgi:hypothetical protein
MQIDSSGVFCEEQNAKGEPVMSSFVSNEDSR